MMMERIDCNSERKRRGEKGADRRDRDRESDTEKEKKKTRARQGAKERKKESKVVDRQKSVKIASPNCTTFVV